MGTTPRLETKDLPAIQLLYRGQNVSVFWQRRVVPAEAFPERRATLT